MVHTAHWLTKKVDKTQTQPLPLYTAATETTSTINMINKRLLLAILLLTYSFATYAQTQNLCKAKGNRCQTDMDCCSNCCQPISQGSPWKFCKDVMGGNPVVPPEGPVCHGKGQACQLNTDCCSGICAGFTSKSCWAANSGARGLRGGEE